MSQERTFTHSGTESGRTAGRRAGVAPTPGRKVLVLDDSEVCREVVRYALEKRGHRVVAIDSPFHLDAALDQHRPDLVLVDVSMPAIDGGELVKSVLHRRLHRCPIVLYSDRSVEELEDLVRSSGAAGFIRKTSDWDGLSRSVESFCRSFCHAEPASRKP